MSRESLYILPRRKQACALPNTLRLRLHNLLIPDRGREDRLRSAPPPSEPDVRISRIRLSSRWFTSSRIDMPFGGNGQDPIPANGTENLCNWSPVALMTKAVNMHMVCAVSSCHALIPWLSPIRLALGHSHRSVFCQPHVNASTSLRSLRSTPVTALPRYYGRSDSCPPGSSALRA